MICPLCSHTDSIVCDQDKLRTYYLCNKCSLIFVPRDVLIAEDQERIRYESHENLENDPNYQIYLGQVVNAIVPFLSKGSSGLDFGCGKTTLMSRLFLEQSFHVDSYDYFFLKDETIWEKKYDFIILSEVIEHLRDLKGTMQKLKLLLNSGGAIFIKTKFYPEDLKAFSSWFYKRDITHIQFFNDKSMHYLAQELSFKNVSKLNCADLIQLKE